MENPDCDVFTGCEGLVDIFNFALFTQAMSPYGEDRIYENL